MNIHKGKQNMPPRIVIYGQEGVGKAQPLEAKILTPTGWQRMGEMKIGSQVIGRDGKAHNVIGVFPQGEKTVYDVIFEDGSITQCCDDHLWATTTVYEHDFHKEGCIRTLRKIRQTIKYGTRFNHRVPRVMPVQFKEQSAKLPISPWLLGIYLAEGTSENCVSIYNREEYIRDRIAKELHDDDKLADIENGKGLRVSRKEFQSQTGSQMIQALRAMELCGKRSDQKFIPECYRLASVENRLELLRGLADGDGFVTSESLEICTASDQMAEDIVFIARSLGFCVTIHKRGAAYKTNGVVHECKDSNRIVITHWGNMVPVSSPKHLAKIKNVKYNMCHLIVDVQEAGVKECQCIMIDAPDELYVTDDFIVTHNTTLASKAPRPLFIPTEDGLANIDCDSTDIITSYSELCDIITELGEDQQGYKTVVIDSADWLEPMIVAHLCKKQGVSQMSKLGGGFGREYDQVALGWRELTQGLDYLRGKGMAAIVIAHCRIAHVKDPMQDSYDKYNLNLYEKSAAVLTEWADAVLFASKKFRLQSDSGNEDRKIAKAIGENGGDRILWTEAGPACTAKNRYGMPFELPLDWDAVNEYIKWEITDDEKQD